jgi:hypothetical protein
VELVRAYIDESVREAAPGLYVLASVAVPADQADDVRAALRSGLRHRRPRFHWRDEEDGDRQAMAKVARELQLPALVAVSTPMDPKRPERARRVCLTRLLWELEQRGLLDVLFESRQNRDRDDRAHIVRAQKAGHCSRSLTYGFELPLQEPLLWLPDLVAGAVAYARVGRGEECLALLGESVTVVDAGAGT